MRKLLFGLLSISLISGIVVLAQEATTGSVENTGTVEATTPVTANPDTTNPEPMLTSEPVTTTSSSSIAPACLKPAIQAREDSIKAGMDTYYASWTAAFNARTTALISITGSSTKKAKIAAIRKARSTYKKAISTAKSIKKKSAAVTWKTYRTAVKKCTSESAAIFRGYENGASDLVE